MDAEEFEEREGRKMLLWLAAGALAAWFFASGCGSDISMPDSTPRPGQETAVAIVLAESGHAEASAPVIYWIDDLDCNDGLGFTSDGGGCHDGLTIRVDGRVTAMRLAWRPGETWASSALAHELVCHALGNDSDHSGVCAPGSPVLSRVHRALAEAFPGPQPWWSAAW